MFEHSRDTFYVSDGISFSNLRFENDVEMYGAQADWSVYTVLSSFENDVEMYGAQADTDAEAEALLFEHQTFLHHSHTSIQITRVMLYCLRMM